MKTLDEVMFALEGGCYGFGNVCSDMGLDKQGFIKPCPYHYDGDTTDECRHMMCADALHYLQEYRSVKHLQEVWMQEADKCKDARENYIARLKELDIGTLNNPMTWDELRTMEGKPVWVEWEMPSEWLLITYIDEKEMCICDHTAIQTWLQKIDMGTQWQAYRKER